MSDPIEFPIGEVELISKIVELMSDGKKRLVADIMRDLRNQDVKFNNENATETIANLDGVAIERTGDDKGSSKEYVKMDEFDQEKLKQILEKAMQERVDLGMLMIKQAFFLELCERIHRIKTLDEDDQRQIEIDVALFSVITSKELDKDNLLISDSKGEPHLQSQGLRNVKTVMLAMEKEIKKLYLASENKLNIQREIKKFAKMNEPYLHKEYQSRMRIYVPEYDYLLKEQLKN